MQQKQKRFIAILSFVLIMLTTFAYSALATSLSITGEANFRTPANIRVTNIAMSGQSGANLEYEPRFTKDTITAGFTLANTSSTISYSVTITNSGDQDYAIYDLITQSSNNSGLIILIDGKPINQALPISVPFGTSKTVTITYSSSTPGRVDVVNKFDFRKMYYVDYNLQGGTSTDDDLNNNHELAGRTYGQIKYENVNLTLSSSEPTKSGYRFTGWNTKADGTGTNYAKGSNYTENSNKILYAMYERSKYTITFNPHNGEETTTKEVVVGDPVGTLSTPTKDGYSFNGWFTQASGGTQITSSTVPTDDTTYHAQWTPYVMTINYYANGAQKNGNTQLTSQLLRTETFDYDSTTGSFGTVLPDIGLPGYVGVSTAWNLSKNGYHNSSYWHVGSANSTTKINQKTKFDNSQALATAMNKGNDFKTGNVEVNIYAGWTANTYTLHFDKNNESATGVMSDQTLTYDDQETNRKINKNVFTLTGHTFVGWNTQANGQGTAYTDEQVINLVTTNNQTINLYAQWIANTYTVTYNANGGTVSVPSKQVTYGSTYGALTEPSREGYTFDNWIGKNQFNEEDYDNLNDYTIDTGSYRLSRIYLKPNTTYRVSVVRYNNFDGKLGYILINNNIDHFPGGDWNSITHATSPNRFLPLTTGDDGILYIGHYNFSQSDLDTVWANTDVQIEEGDNITSYEPYQVITSSTTVTTTSNHTIYAKWTANNYTVTANANGGTIASTTGWTGTGNTSTKSVTYDSAYGTLPTVSRTGYTFKGWNGKNLFNINAINDTTQPSYSIQIKNDKIILTGTQYACYTGKTISEIAPNLKIGDRVKLKFNTTSSKNFMYLYGINLTWPNGTSKTISQDVLDSELYIYNEGNLTEPNEVEISNIQLILSTTSDETYEPYYVTEDTIVKQAKDHTLTAIYSANELTFNDQTGSTTYNAGTAQSVNIVPATNGTGSYTYSKVSESNGTSDTNYFSITGNNKVTASANTPVGTYNVVVKATDNGSGATKNATYTITVNKQKINVPTCGTFTYNKSTQTLLSNTTTYTVTDNTGLNADTYTVKATPTSNYMWSDDTTTTKNVSCTINPYNIGTSGNATVSPVVDRVYDGTPYEPTPSVTVPLPTSTNPYTLTDSDITYSYTTDHTNVGSKQVTITGKGNYTGTINKSYNITKANGFVTLNKTTENVEYSTVSTTFKVLTHSGDVSVSDDNATATVSITGDTVTVSNISTLSSGTTVVVTVTSAANTNYKEATTTYTLNITNKPLVGGSVTITGNNIVGNTLTATVTDTTPAGNYTYKWYREGSSAVIATTRTYTVTSSDVGKNLRVVVTATKDNYESTSFEDTTDATNNKTEKAKTGATKPTSTYCKSLTYNGDTQVLTNSAGTGYAFYDNSGIAATSYTVTAKLQDNYIWSNGDTADVTFNCSIARRDVTVKADNQSKEYDGTALTANTSCTATGNVTGHTPSCTTSGTITDYAASGAVKTLSSAKIMSGTTDVSSNYNITLQNGTLTITKKAITITAKGQTVQYGTAISKTTSDVTVATLPASDTLDSITLTQSKTAVSTDGKITASNAVIKRGNTTTTNNYTITYNQGSLTINKKNITASISSCSNKVYDGNTTASCGITLSGVQTGETATATATCNFNNKNVGTGKEITCNTFVLDGANKGNYNITTTSLTGSANITAKSITPTATASNKTYDGNANATCTISLPGIISGDTVSSTYTGTFNNKNVGNSKAVTCSSIALTGTDKDNYSLSATSVSTTANVTAKSVAVSWTNVGPFTYNGSNQGPTATVNTGITGETMTVNATKAINKGTHTSTATCSSVTGSSACGNYTLTNNTKEFTINAQAVNPVTNLAVNTSGIVSWTASSNATGYQISTNGSTWTNIPSSQTSYNYLSVLTASSSNKTVYVRAINSDTDNYSTVDSGDAYAHSSNATSAVTIRTLTINSNNDNYGTVNNTTFYVINGATYSTNGNVLTLSDGRTSTASKIDLTGYTTTFSSWSSTSGTISANTTVTANFTRTANTYTVTANANGGTIASTTGWTGTGNTSTKGVTYDSAYGTLPTVSKAGYTFKGWSLLPEGYKQVDYIQSTNQYIDLDVTMSAATNSSLVQKAGIQYDETYSGRHLMGGSGAKDNYFGINFSGSGVFDMGSRGTYVIELGKKYDIVASIVDNNAYFKAFYNNQLVDSFTSNYGIITDSSFTIFNLSASRSYQMTGAKIYYYQIYIDDELKFYGIPCYRESDGSVGFYDLVRGNFYGKSNSTSTDFTYGEEIYVTSDTIVKTDTNHTIYAHWSPITYNLTYDLRDGSVATANPTTYNIETNTFTLNNPTRSGYTFNGWTGSNGNTPSTSVSIAKGSTGDKSFTANWSKAASNLTVTLSQDSYTYDGTAKEPTVTVKDGTTTIPASEYDVTYSNNKNAGTATATITMKGNYYSTTKATYTGSTTKNFTIGKKALTITAENKSMNYGASAPTYTYTSSGAVSGESPISGTVTYTIKSGTTTISNVSTANAGSYTIVPSGLTINNNYSVSYVNGTLTINKLNATASNVQVSTAGVVSWTGTNATGYQISIDGTNWTSVLESQKSGYNYLSTIVAATGSRTVYVKAVNSDTTNYNNQSTAASASVTVNTIYIYRNNNNYGIITPSSLNVISGSKVSANGATLTFTGNRTLPATPIQVVGYTTTFSKWTQSTASGTQITSTEVDVPSTIYANFTRTANNYTVTANANSGSIASTTGWTGTGNTATKSVTYDSTYGTLPTISKTGYTLAGWSLLPDGYKQVEYIQSSGTQYIDTGYYWQHENIEAYLDATVLTNGSAQSLFGNEENTTSSGDTRNFAGIPHGANGNYGIFIGSTSQGSVNTGMNTRFKLDIYTTSAKNLFVSLDNTIKIDRTYGGSVMTHDTVYKTSNTSTTVGNIFLFANHNSSRGSSNAAIQTISSMRVYAFKLIDNGTLVRDMVPCYNESTGKYGMYDIVNGTFYGNAATSGSDFTAPSAATYITSSTTVNTPSAHNIYAKWTKNTYTTKFASTSACPLNATTYADVASTFDTTVINKANPTCTGYTFDGWTLSNGDTNTAKYGTSSANTAWANKNKGTYFTNLASAQGATPTLTANWVAKTTTLTLNATTNSGTYSGTTPRTMTFDQSTNNSVGTASKTGYTFTGWFTSASGGTKVYDQNGQNVNASGYWSAAYSSGVWKNESSSMTLYAQFSKNAYTIAFNSNKPSAATGTIGGSTSSSSCSYDTACTLTSNGYTLSGWKFIGWNTKADGTGTAYLDGASVTNLATSGTTTLYAQWIRNDVTISLLKDGSAYSNSGMQVTLYNGTTATSHTATVSSGSTATFTEVAAGTYNIYIGKDSNHKTGTSNLVDSNMDVTVPKADASIANGNTATQTVRYYTLTVGLSHATVTVNGTSVSNNGTVVVAGGTDTTASNYAHAIVATASTGYEFASGATIWTKNNNNSSITSATTASTTAKLGGASTITATATIQSHTLTINPNGGTYNNKTTNTTVTQNYNTTTTVLNNPTRAGYNFGGWQLTSGNGDITYFEDSDKVSQYIINSTSANTPGIYNNKGNGNVTKSIVSDSASSTGYSLKIQTNGEASPGTGGFVNSVSAQANKVYYHKIIAKIPTGYSYYYASNSMGIGYGGYYIGSQAGTNSYKEYLYVQYSGANGPFSNFGHVYLYGSDDTSVIWNLQESTIYAPDDLTFRFLDSDATLTAVWRESGSNITFDYQNGSQGSGSLTGTWSKTSNAFYYNSSYTSTKYAPYYISSEENAIYRDGYTFGGFYTAADGGTKLFDTDGSVIASVSPYTNASKKWLYYDSSFTTYARWTKAASDLTVTLSQDSYTYDGNAKQPTVTVKDGSTTIPSSAYTVSYSNNTGYGTATATVTMNNTYVSGTKAYYTGSTSKTFTINKRTVSITSPTLKSGTLTYNGSAQNISGSAGTCSAGGTMYYYTTNYTSTTAPTFNASTWTTTYPTTINQTNAGTYKLWYYCKVDDTTNNTGTNINTALSVTKDINPKQLDVTKFTVNNGSKTYDGNTNVKSGFGLTANTTSGLVSGDSVTISYTSAAYNVKTTSATTINVSGISQNNSNYSLSKTSNGYTGSITAKALTPTVSASNKTYDGNTDATCSSSVTLTGVVSGDTVTASANTSGTFDNKNVGTGKTVTCSGITLAGTDKGNYSVASSKTTTANITAKTLTITAANKSMTYGGSAPTYTYTSSGEVSGESPISGTATYTIKSGSTTISNVSTADAGSYTIVPSGLTINSNYTATYVNGTLTIGKASCPLTVSNGSMYTGATMALSTRASNNVGTLSYALKSGGNNTTTASTISNGVLTAGAMSTANDNNQTVDVQITEAASTNYNSCTKDVAITVQKNTRTLSWSSTTPAANATLTYGTSYSATASASGSGGTAGAITYSSNNETGATINSTSGAITVENGNSKAVTITATMARTATVAQATTTRAFTTGKATGYVNLSANSGSVTYGTASKSFTVSSSHGGTLSVSDNNTTASCEVSGTTVTCSSLGSINAGTSITVTVTSAATDNYTEASKTYTLSITRATTATTGSCLNPTYNGSAQNLAGNGSNVTYTNNSQTNHGSSDYTVTVTPNANYAWSDGTYAAKTLSCNIEKATPTITITSGTSIINDGYIVAGRVANQTVVVKSGASNASVSGTLTSVSSKEAVVQVAPSSTNITSANNSTGIDTIIAVTGVAGGNATISYNFTPTDTINFNSAILSYELQGYNKIDIKRYLDGVEATSTSGEPKMVLLYDPDGNLMSYGATLNGVFGDLKVGTYRLSAYKSSLDNTTVDTGSTVTITEIDGVKSSGVLSSNYYTLTLNKDSNVTTVTGAGYYLSNQTASISATAFATGYHFGSWSKTSGNTPARTTSASTTVSMSAATTLTANASINSYTIAFNTNGGSGTMSSLTNKNYNTSVTLTNNSFTRNGYTFIGWNTKADGSGTAYLNGASMSINSSLISQYGLENSNGTITLYAQWIQNGSVTITGTNKVGQTLTASVSAPTPAPSSYTYQWYRGTTAINGATSSTYTPVAADVGSTLKVEVTANYSNYNSATFEDTTDATNNTYANTNGDMVCTNAVGKITGYATKGGTLTATVITAPTPTPTSYTYQWYRGTTIINGATGSTYTPVAADVGSTIKVRITGVKDNYVSCYFEDSIDETNNKFNVVTEVKAVDVYYDNTNTGMTCETAQCALDNISRMLNRASSQDPDYIIGHSYLCRRASASELHTETCSYTSGSSYCYADGYYASGSQGTTTITYGSTGTAGQLTTGDAFICDVDGDGTYNTTNEMFYYVTDYYNTTLSTPDTNHDYAVLVHYRTVKDGGYNGNTTPYATLSDIQKFDSSISTADNWHGPATAFYNIYTTLRWKDIGLYKNSRQILNESAGTNIPSGGNLPIFSYKGYSGRLLTYQEVYNGCYDGSNAITSTGSLSTKCKFLFENTKYYKSSTVGSGILLETPTSDSTKQTYVINPQYRRLGTGSSYSSTYLVRPVIEVKKSDISY